MCNVVEVANYDLNLAPGHLMFYHFQLTLLFIIIIMQVLDYSAGFSLGGGGVGGAGGGAHPGGGHDLWADSVLGLGEAQADTDLRSIREQETEVILAFTLLVTILLTFVGSDQTFTFRYLKNILTIF